MDSIFNMLNRKIPVTQAFDSRLYYVLNAAFVGPIVELAIKNEYAGLNSDLLDLVFINC